MSEATVTELLRRARDGDRAAAVELVRRYEPHIRLEVRLRLRDRRLRRLFDSMDICQSVLSSFFLRTAARTADLQQPEQLLPLLIAMTRNKLAFKVRQHRARRRDHRREEETQPQELRQVAAAEASPSELVAGEELLKEFRRRLTAEEAGLADRRALGQEWTAIATELGGSPEARRKQLERAVDRVVKELRLEE
jgi:RNA polymerase sigma-70 factor (ECF subfamily)